MGLPRETPLGELDRCVYQERAKKPVKPKLVATGPVKRGHNQGQVDLFQFPAPRWHDRMADAILARATAWLLKTGDRWVNIVCTAV